MDRISDFYWSEQREPHFGRRKLILEEFPEVKNLFGIDHSLKFKAIFWMLLHLGISIFLPENIWLLIAVVLVLGTTLVHIIVLAIHEITHDLAFENRSMNNWLAMLVNLPILFPFAMSFKAYHAEHHWFQGKDHIDTDIPSKIEAKLFKGFFGKFLWMFLQIPFYAIRPLIIRPMKPDKWIIINLLIQVAFVSVYFYLVGWYGTMYLFCSLALAGGLHPIGGHFVSEHYIFSGDQETYSYYGPLNKLVFNVGYHNEHHDFPNIPGSKLPELKRIAGKHYDNLHSYNSWTYVIIQFLSNSKMTLFSRVKRDQ